MRIQKGSMRYWLQATQRALLMGDLRPFNMRWKFSRKRDEKAVRAVIARLREIADGLEARL